MSPGYTFLSTPPGPVLYKVLSMVMVFSVTSWAPEEWEGS